MKTVSGTSYKWAARIKLKIFPQNLNILEAVLPPMNGKPNFSLVVYDDISDHSDEDGQVNVNSRGQSFYNLRQYIDPLRRYGDIATYVFEAIACKLCL